MKTINLLAAYIISGCALGIVFFDGSLPPNFMEAILMMILAEKFYSKAEKCL